MMNIEVYNLETLLDWPGVRRMIAVVQELEGSPESSGKANGTIRPPAVLPLVAILHQLEALVDSLTDEQYVLKPVGVVPSSIGGHVRHSLDHINALLIGLRNGEVNYDQRQRGTNVELCRRSALETMRRQEQLLLAFPWVPSDQWLRLSVLLTAAGPSVTVTTTLDRELAFVLSHTIHHNSLIGVMVKLLGVPVPEDFGYAPSTLAHKGGRPCVR
jgi:uncharacterized damage-inducible protein DinB